MVVIIAALVAVAVLAGAVLAAGRLPAPDVGLATDPDPDPDAPVGVPRAPFRPDPVLVGCVAVGGALGGAARYAVAQALPRPDAGFPWATLLVNLLGAAVLGFVLVALADRPAPADRWRAFLGTGVCGGFTTFSTLSVEVVLLTRDGAATTAVGYVVVSVVAGLAMVVAGMWSARRLAFRP